MILARRRATVVGSLCLQVVGIALVACHGQSAAVDASAPLTSTGGPAEETFKGLSGPHGSVPLEDVGDSNGRNGTALDRLVIDAVELLARYRGWRRLSPPGIVEGSSNELRQWLKEELLARVPVSVARAQDHSLSLLGLLPSDYDSTAVSLDVFANTVQGAYLTTRGTIVVRRGLRLEEASAAIFHEMVHAFQDHLYGLGSKLSHQVHQGDRIAAVHALAEGEATRLEVELARAKLGVRSSELTDELVLGRFDALRSQANLPAIIGRSLVAPYRDGYRFVSYLRQLGDFTLVDAVWQRGLASTAELLHPERWIRTDGGNLDGGAQHKARSGGYAALPGDGDLLFEETLGEQGVRILLEETEPAEQAAKLASTWEEDDLWVVRVGGDKRLVWRLRCRARSDAVLLARTMGRALVGSLGVDGLCRRMPAATLTLLVRNRDIVVAASSPADTAGGAFGKLDCKRLGQWANAVSRTSDVAP